MLTKWDIHVVEFFLLHLKLDTWSYNGERCKFGLVTYMTPNMYHFFYVNFLRGLIVTCGKAHLDCFMTLITRMRQTYNFPWNWSSQEQNMPLLLETIDDWSFRTWVQPFWCLILRLLPTGDRQWHWRNQSKIGSLKVSIFPRLLSLFFFF